MTEEQEKTYREGDDETTEPTSIHAGGAKEAPPTEDSAVEEKPDAGPITTAFLMVLRPNGSIEAATELPMIETERLATLRDVRDMCHSMFCDIQNSMTGKVSASETNILMRQMFAGMVQQPKSNIITPGGRG